MTTIIDGSAGITFPNSTVQASAGSVLQVVQGSYSTQVTTTSLTPVTTNVTASITPKFSTSKILAIVNLAGCGKNNLTAGSVAYYLYKNASSVFVSTDVAFYNSSNAGGNFGNLSFAYLDSPATTSSTTYTIYIAAVGSGATAYAQNYNASQANNTSTITLMEIAA